MSSRSLQTTKSFLALLLTVSLLVTANLRADDPQEVSLMTPGSPNLGWSFDNGQEFPGATGSVAIDPDHQREGHDMLILKGDFSAGGAYVRANVPIPNVDIDKLTFWLRSPNSDLVTVRLLDSAGECHQFKIRATLGTSWDRVIFPVADYFEGMKPNKRQSVTNVIGYETWGGPNDKTWHGPAKSLDILLGPTPLEKVVSLGIGDVTVTVKPPPTPASP